MADEQESVVLVAIARAASKYSPDEGFGLPVKREDACDLRLLFNDPRRVQRGS